MMEDKLRDIGTYIVQKITDGQYEFISCNEHVAKISIEGIEFLLWIANFDNFRLYSYVESDQQIFTKYAVFSKKKKALAVQKLKSLVENYQYQEKLKQLKELQKDISHG